jgi:5-methylcytosine-specific restriction endonuclease McrA
MRRKRRRSPGWVPFSEYQRTKRAASWGVEEHFTSTMKRRIMKQFGRCCFRCKAIKRLQIDHNNPLYLGNALDYGNAVVLCRSCNLSKGTKIPAQFYTSEECTRLSALLAEQRSWKDIQQQANPCK